MFRRNRLAGRNVRNRVRAGFGEETPVSRQPEAAACVASKGSYDPWVRIALGSEPWSEARRMEARERLASALHLGEVAEAMRCSVFELQAELEIGRTRDVRAYRRMRGL